jgi:hypothetical protein
MKTLGRSPVASPAPARLALAVAMALSLAGAEAAPAAPHAAPATTVARSAQGSPDFEWSGRLASGRTLEVEGVNGAIHATAAAGAEVVVHALKHAKHSDPDRVTVEVLEHADGVTLCVRYPDTWGHHNTCAPHGRSHMDTHDNDVEVDFDVKLPAGVSLVARTVNGEVEATGLGADVEAHTVNGSITLETRGRGEANTVNGSIEARLGALGVKAPLEFTTVNGGITLELPADVGAEVSAKCVNGGIQSDFPVLVHKRGFVGQSLSGTLGHGGPHLQLSTVNGAIELKKAHGI